MGYWIGDVYLPDQNEVSTEPAFAPPSPDSWDYWGLGPAGRGTIGGPTQLTAVQAQNAGMSAADYWKWVQGYNSRPGVTATSSASDPYSGNIARAFVLEHGGSQAEADQLASQAQAQWGDYRAQQDALNRDHGLGTFLTLLALGVGGGALAAGGLGAGVGANAAGAMGIEAGAAGGAGSGLAAGAGGAFDMGGLAGTGIPEAWGLGAGDLSAGWGVTQGASGMDGGLFSRYGLGIPGNDAAVGSLLDSFGNLGLGGSSLSSIFSSPWLDVVKQGGSVLKSLGIGPGGDNNGLLGAGLGALLGSLDGSKQAGTTTTTTEPWAAQQPYLMAGFGSALNQLGTTPTSAVLGPAEQGLLATIRGDYLNANPWLDATYQKAANQVLPGIEGYFSRAGRTGSASAADALSNAASKLATDIYGGNYARERGFQNQGILGAPTFANNATAARFAPTLNYMQAIGGNRGTSTSTPYFDNQWGSILSGALAGYGLLGGGR